MALLDELVSLNAVGMILITLSWIIQIASMVKGKNGIRREFALLQSLGIACIAAGMISVSTTIGVLNLLSATGAACVLVLLLKSRSG